MKRAAVELAKLWRLDKYLRRLEVRCKRLFLRLKFLACLLPKAVIQHSSMYFSVASGRQAMPVMQATMVVADAKESLTITGNGDVVEPHDGVVGESIT